MTAALLSATAQVGKPAARAAIQRIQRVLPGIVEHDSASSCIHAIRLSSTGASGRTEAERANLLTGLSLGYVLMGAFRNTAMRAAVRQQLEVQLRAGAGQVDDYFRRIRPTAKALSPGSTSAEVIQSVLRGLFATRRIRCTYADTRGGTTVVELKPLTLLLDDLGLHLYAQCTQSADKPTRIGTYGTFALARMTDVVVAEPFAYPAPDEFNPDAIFGPAFGMFVPRSDEERAKDVVLVFDGTWKPYLEAAPIHASQKLRSVVGAGGASDIEVRLHVYITYDLVHWIRGHGDSVRVLGPERLARWVGSGAGLEGPAEPGE